MEAILGVAWLTGGVEMVLQAGTLLNLCFGGAEPWPTRYSSKGIAPTETPPGLQPIEEMLGYKFHDPLLLREALTHPSCPAKETCSYNRLEFLGDGECIIRDCDSTEADLTAALVDIFIMQYLFTRFLDAPPGKLTWARAAAVCNTTLAAVAVKELSLDKFVLHASSKLPQATETARVMFESLNYAEIIEDSWRFDPPKVLGDLLESVMGAVFVDSNYDLRTAFTVLERVMANVLVELHPDLPMDPATELMIYGGSQGCSQIRLR